MKNLLIISILSVLLYLFGIFTHRNQLFPYSNIKRLKIKILEKKKLKKAKESYKSIHYDKVINQYSDIDLKEYYNIEENRDISFLRGKLIKKIFSKNIINKKIAPKFVGELISIKKYKKLKKLNLYQYKMELGFNSFIYEYIPKKINNKIIILHQGHGGSLGSLELQLNRFIYAGYTVYCLYMPNLGPNKGHPNFIYRDGKIIFDLNDVTWNHKFMAYIEMENSSPLKFFLEPVISVVNLVKKKNINAEITMVGLSGGGWTTTLASAIDDRIKYSFPVAGSYPIFIRRMISPNGKDDWEQESDDFLSIASYLDLYIMGGSGKGRKQVQILNKYDSCCFNGEYWKIYKEFIEKQVNELGEGKWTLFCDESHAEHKISNLATDLILNEIK